MEARGVEELGAVTIAVAAFVAVAFGFHLLATYIREGSLLFSALGAGVQTVIAAIIFLPLHRALDAVKTAIVGFALYAALFLVLYSYVWVPSSYSLKVDNVYLFQGGAVTLQGILRNLMTAVVHAALSSLAFIVCFRFGLLCRAERTRA
jgi:hypothetical protein